MAERAITEDEIRRLIDGRDAPDPRGTVAKRAALVASFFSLAAARRGSSPEAVADAAEWMSDRGVPLDDLRAGLRLHVESFAYVTEIDLGGQP